MCLRMKKLSKRGRERCFKSNLRASIKGLILLNTEETIYHTVICTEFMVKIMNIYEILTVNICNSPVKNIRVIIPIYLHCLLDNMYWESTWHNKNWCKEIIQIDNAIILSFFPCDNELECKDRHILLIEKESKLYLIVDIACSSAKRVCDKEFYRYSR